MKQQGDLNIEGAATTEGIPVVERADPSRVVGMFTRSDLLSAHGRRLEEEER